MANQSLPLLFLNLGGEMVYILDQRLRAQRIARDKSARVLEEICGLMLNERFILELFQPQPLGHIAALRSLFRDLAHASIMRLDDDSMSKMWDLMTMSVKYQAMRASSPLELVMATLNHLDTIGAEVPAVRSQAEHAHCMMVKRYGRMPSGELQAVRYCLLNYLQGLAVRVSLFLKMGIQDMEANLLLPAEGPVPPGCEVPGTIRVLDGHGREEDAVIHVSYFPAGGDFAAARESGSLELHGGRGTNLGLNMYRSPDEAGVGLCVGYPAGAVVGSGAGAPGPPGAGAGRALRVGREELNMLMAQLLGNRPTPSHAQSSDVPARLIRVSLFNSQGPANTPAPGTEVPGCQEEPSGGGGGEGDEVGDQDANVLSIDATGSAGSRSVSLQRILSDLDSRGVDEAGAAGAGVGGFMDLWEDVGLS